MDIIQKLSDELKLAKEQVEKTVTLIDAGNTIPFIARYRKEETGSLDDTVLRTLEDRLTYLRNIEKRKEEVSNLITEMGKMTGEIAVAIENAQTITEVDDIYRPFRPHRKTRASVAKEKGLEPLAELLLAQETVYTPSLEEQAATYVNEEKQVESATEALAGACDIIAEMMDDLLYHHDMQFVMLGTGDQKYEDYFRQLQDRHPDDRSNIPYTWNFLHSEFPSKQMFPAFGHIQFR